MVSVIAYARVSTDEQKKKGVSLEAQVEAMRRYAEAHGHVVVDVLQETASASSMEPDDRPRLDYALRRVRRGEAGALLVTKLDRLTRSTADLDTLLTKHFGQGGLLSADGHIDTTTASGRVILRLITDISQWEREAIGERTRAVLSHKKSLGERTTRFAPYGFEHDDNGRVVPNAAEAEVIALVRRLRAEDWYLREIVEELARRGHRPRGSQASFFALKKKRPAQDGDRFTIASIQRMCRGVRAPRAAKTGDTHGRAQAV